MFQAPINKVIVKFKTKYIRNFTSIMKMAAIQNNTSIEPADYCNIICEVVSVPKKISTHLRDYEGFSAADIRPGDTAIVSHSVIYNFSQLEPEAEPIYKNMVWYKGHEFFSADIQHVFAVIRNEQIRMQNGYVMIQDLEATPKIILSAATKRSIMTAAGTLTHIGRPLTTSHNIDVVPGDKVYYNPQKITIYQTGTKDAKPFGILRQKDILGRSISDYKKISEII